MIHLGSATFDEIWFVDFEFNSSKGERPQPVCLVAYELGSGRSIECFGDDLLRLGSPPYPISKDALFVSYFATAELGCHLALNWSLPAYVLDLYVEFRNLTNGLDTPAGSGLLGALIFFGLDAMDVVEKEAMRKFALRGGPYSAGERRDLLDYCGKDVQALRDLFNVMLPRVDLPRALLRGREMKAIARMEYLGVPMDIGTLALLREGWEQVQDELVRRVDRDYGVFEGRSFRANRFANWLSRHNIPWPHLESGRLALDDDTFRLMARLHPQIERLRQVRVALSQMRLGDLAVGPDGRNRTLLSPFRARTGRNQPSNAEFIFGPAVWLRSLIKPAPGMGIAEIDYSQQEFGIAAALSEDASMLAAYSSGDPYLAFAKQARAVPADATKSSHGNIRNQYKECALAVQYGMGAESLARRIGLPVIQAKELLRIHHETYKGFWLWSDAVVDHAMLYGSLPTVFGWIIHVGAQVNPRMLRNFPMQANGAEMLRLACSLATERGIQVLAPVHDAILIEAPLGELDAAVETAQKAMADASDIVLNGFRLRSEAKSFCYPDRFKDERGEQMWSTVLSIINELAPNGTGA